MKYLSDNKGYTLAEMIIALSLLVIVMAGGYSFLTFSHKVFFISTEGAFAQNELRLILEEIKSELEMADYIEICNVPDNGDIETDDTHSIIYIDNKNQRLVIDKYNEVENFQSLNGFSIEFSKTPLGDSEENLIYGLLVNVSTMTNSGPLTYEELIIIQNLTYSGKSIEGETSGNGVIYTLP
jgi:prepilin-type N-terminal cleavage/methylation domain-containing protein